MNYKDIIELEERIKKDNASISDEDAKRIWNRFINALWRLVNPQSLN